MEKHPAFALKIKRALEGESDDTKIKEKKRSTAAHVAPFQNILKRFSHGKFKKKSTD
ncbi:conserved hypothetical protein [Ricinus communis]|uniref:Uncharacterized protein n=1 Tax=Ricinus communis TaxID=3988 RepID=B9S4Y9_RICCO|nr:conserved hypothetical protein [Ricinus communis]